MSELTVILKDAERTYKQKFLMYEDYQWLTQFLKNACIYRLRKITPSYNIGISKNKNQETKNEKNRYHTRNISLPPILQQACDRGWCVNYDGDDIRFLKVFRDDIFISRYIEEAEEFYNNLKD